MVVIDTGAKTTDRNESFGSGSKMPSADDSSLDGFKKVPA